MKTAPAPWFTLLIMFAMLIGGTTLHAQEDLKARFSARLPQIDALKLQLLVGENNKGYLEARGNLSSAQEALMKAENADRKTLYGMLANKRGIDTKVVGEARAAQIYEKSEDASAKVWVQDKGGIWRRI